MRNLNDTIRELVVDVLCEMDLDNALRRAIEERIDCDEVAEHILDAVDFEEILSDAIEAVLPPF